MTLSANSEMGYDDNVLRQQTNPLGSRLLVVTPRVGYSIQAGGGLYTLGYELNRSEYLDSGQDSSTTQNLSLSVDQKLNSSNKVTVAGSYNHSYEGRGVGFNEGSNALSLSSPTPLVTEALSGKYQLGSDRATMRLIGSLGYMKSDRASPSIANDSRDYHVDSMGALMEYRVGSRTDLVAEWRDNQTSYDRTPVASDGTETPLDSDEQLYLIGLDLAATAKTSGKLRVGTSKRDFKWKSAQWEDAKTAATTPAATVTTVRFPNDTGGEFYWEFSAAWSPRAYAKFEFNTRTSTREALGVGSFVRVRDYSLSWSHLWKARLHSKLDFTIGNDTYVDSSRVDKRKAYNARLEYDFNSLLTLGFGYRYQQMISNAGNVGFDKSVYYIFANYYNK